MAPFLDEKLKERIRAFNERGQLGPDPLGERYAERRAGYSLFAPMMSDADIEALRAYIFCYRELPPRNKLTVRNYIAGEWRAPASGEHATMTCPADKRVQLFDVPASGKQDVEAAVSSGDQVWKSLAWAEEGLAYRKHVVKNVSRILAHYTEEFLHEIRQQIPKTRLEAEKDFFEAKRACDHLEGSYEAAIQGEMVPDMFAGQRFWRDSWMPGGLAAIITPMNFIWGIPMIHLTGAYLIGCPWILKGHPFAAATNTSMVRSFLAAGADPRFIQKVEGFGKGIAPLATDRRVAVVAVTGSSDTARAISAGRGIRAHAFRRRRLQLVMGGRWVRRRGAGEDRGPPHLREAGALVAQVHRPARRVRVEGNAGPAGADDRGGDGSLAGGRSAQPRGERQDAGAPDGAQGPDRARRDRRGAQGRAQDRS